MKSKTSRHCLKRLSSLLLAVALCIGMMPGAFAAQENGYHDPAEHWQEANDRTNELDANATVTHETFNAGFASSRPLSLPSAHRNIRGTARRP